MKCSMQQQNPIIYYQQQQQPYSFHTSDNPSTLLTIAVLCIIGAAAALLLAYYILLNKCCCFNFTTTTTWFLPSSTATTTFTGQPDADDSFIALSPANWTRRGGMGELAIQALPTREYRTGGVLECGSIYGCVVCLNEFKEQDVLRVLPNCDHAFHLRCIDLWLQSNAVCPLCRTSISSGQVAAGHYSDHHHHHVVAPSSSPRGSQQQAESVMGSDEDFVVIELGGDGGARDIVVSAAPPPAPRRRFRSQSPKVVGKWKQSKCGGRHLSSTMGDEGIDYVRMGKGDDGDQFSIQPIRRSFSWDSAADRQLLSSVRALLIRQSSSSSSSRGGMEGRSIL